jgi:hypothetical protein
MKLKFIISLSEEAVRGTIESRTGLLFKQRILGSKTMAHLGN